MAEKRTDTFTELLDETAARLEAQLKFMRRQQASLPDVDSVNKASACLASLEVGLEVASLECAFGTRNA